MDETRLGWIKSWLSVIRQQLLISRCICRQSLFVIVSNCSLSQMGIFVFIIPHLKFKTLCLKMKFMLEFITANKNGTKLLTLACQIVFSTNYVPLHPTLFNSIFSSLFSKICSTVGDVTSQSVQEMIISNTVSHLGGIDVLVSFSLVLSAVKGVHLMLEVIGKDMRQPSSG